MKLIAYDKVDGDWTCFTVDGEIPDIELSDSVINPFFAIGVFIAKALDLPCSLDESLDFFYDARIQKILKQVACFAFYHNDIAYVPFQGLGSNAPVPGAFLFYMMEERHRMLLEWTYVEYGEFAPHKTPDFILLDGMDYNFWSGVSEALYCGFFVKGTENWNHYYIPRDQFPSLEALDSVKGIVITGSRYCSFLDPKSWKQRLCEIIKTYHERARFIGICFGHQIIAKALDGETGKNPLNNFIYKFEQLEGFKNIRIMESHGDCVTQLPPDAVRLFHSNTCNVESYQIHDKVLTMQGHPEFTPYFVKYCHSKCRFSAGLIDLDHYNSIKKECLVPNNSLEVIEAFNTFLRTGVNTLALRVNNHTV
jgi:GMP synthase-like glutamine amidotransferase